MGGTYQIVVGGAGGTTGGYTVQVTLNAALEMRGTSSGSRTIFRQAVSKRSMQSIPGIMRRLVRIPRRIAATRPAFYRPPSVVVEFRNYATFSLPTLTPTILSAELRMISGSYSSPDPTETYSRSMSPRRLRHSTPIAHGDLAGIGIFGDLGSGNNFGSRVVRRRTPIRLWRSLLTRAPWPP
jgi:hypothetical protein